MNRRLVIVILLTLLPWPAVAYGMYVLHSIVWTFALYHGACLLPGIIWGRSLWRGHLSPLTAHQWVALLLVAACSSFIAVEALHVSGTLIVVPTQVLDTLTARGFRAAWLVPFSAYFVIVNATLEELFWRGVVLNELEPSLPKPAGTVWTAVTFGAWHWLVLRALLRPGFAELAVLGAMATGAFCSFLYRRTNSITVAILWHALVFDLAIIALLAAVVH